MTDQRQGPDVFEQILERLNALPTALRQALVDERWSAIPLRVTETAFAPGVIAGAPLLVPAQSNIQELITTVVVSAPAGGGTLQLGAALLPVPAGVSSLGGLALILGPQDVRQLTTAQNGAAGVWLFGEQLPTFGVIG